MLVHLNPDENDNVDKKGQHSQNVIEADRFGKFGCVFNCFWRMTCADVNVVSVMAEDDIKNNLGNPAEDHHQQVNEHTPEFVVESGRIFQPENANVSCDHDAV